MRIVRSLACLALGLVLAPLAAPRDDVGGFVYAVVPFDELEVLDAAAVPDGLPPGTAQELRTVRRPLDAWMPRRFGSRRGGGFASHPRAVLDGPGHATAWFGDWREGRELPRSSQGRLAIRLREARDVTGLVFVPSAEGDGGQVAVPFRVAADVFGDDAVAWRDVVADRADLLFRRGAGGTAWYRSQRDALRAGLPDERPEWVRETVTDLASTDLDRTLGFVSGGRAISENLALDRVLPFGADAHASIDMHSIRGLQTRPYDWATLVEGRSPARDPLAGWIPADQHAMFFPSLAAMRDVAGRVDPILAAVGRFESGAGARTLARYERQLGLSLDGLAAEVGGHVSSVAITGGDPALRTGADVAVLFEAARGAVSEMAVLTFVDGALDVASEPGSVAGHAYTMWRTDDRAVCAYAATVRGVVVVTNSRAQLARIIASARDEVTSLDELDEYTFFRDRYRRGDPAESALLVLSDATIRRWGGPRVRIGASRRARAAAVLGEVTARVVDGRLSVADGAVSAPDDLPDVGTLSLDGGAVVSSSYGTLTFATPVAELDLDLVTREERAAYERWRDGYESRWRTFDPIAVRFGASDGHLEFDTTVRPLMIDSEYDDYVRITAGSAIAPRAGDLHDGTAAHLALALSPDLLDSSGHTSMLDTMSQGVSLSSWLGPSMSIYVDADAEWRERIAQGTWSVYDVFEMPIALQFEVTSGLKLAAFLTSMRAFADQSTPDLLQWETREHAGHRYVRLSAPDFEVDGSATYYVTTPGSLTVSPREDVVRRVIDRHLARSAAREAGDPPPEEQLAPWSGEHIAWRVDVATAIEYAAVMTPDLRATVRDAAWANLPILNEWRRRFPDEHPLDVHERLFARRLVDPTGGRYVWNETWRTYESTAWGHPGAPFPGPDVTTWFGEWLTDFATFAAGLTFEDDGLRAKARAETKDR